MKGLVIDEDGTLFIVSQERQGRGAPVGRRWGLPASLKINAGALVEYTEDHSTGLGPRLGEVRVLKDGPPVFFHLEDDKLPPPNATKEDIIGDAVKAGVAYEQELKAKAKAKGKAK